MYKGMDENGSNTSHPVCYLLKYFIIGRWRGGWVHFLPPHCGRCGVYSPNIPHSQTASAHTKKLSWGGGRSGRRPLSSKGQISAKVDSKTVWKPQLWLGRYIWGWAWDVVVVTNITLQGTNYDQLQIVLAITGNYSKYAGISKVEGGLRGSCNRALFGCVEKLSLVSICS